MPVMQVRIMLVTVNHRRVLMRVGMRLARRIVSGVGMPMVLVMAVAMFMGHRLMGVAVQVPFRQMQI